MQERNGTTQAQPSPATESWPEGVVARYLTVGGALIDIRHDMHLIQDTQPNLTLAECGGEGCHERHTERWSQYAYRNNNGSKSADAVVSGWAQAHAEKCRALPRPAVTA